VYRKTTRSFTRITLIMPKNEIKSKSAGLYPSGVLWLGWHFPGVSPPAIHILALRANCISGKNPVNTASGKNRMQVEGAGSCVGSDRG
jgi:hypothetical protein